MSRLSEKIVTHFRKQYFADKLGPSYRDEFKITQKFFSTSIALEELAYSKGFNDCKKYLDEIIDAHDRGDFKEIDNIIDKLIGLDIFAQETYL